MMLVLSAVSFNQLSAQALNENFNAGIPGTWKIYDVDGLTPNANVSALMTAAWVSNEDGTDTFVTSTSWYTPAGTSNDWLVSPAINLTTGDVLSWRGMAQDASYPDGYEVRISTTSDSVSAFLANPALFTTAAENPTWTNRFVDLDAAGYTNQTVYIAFRNNSTDQFLLHIDNVKVDNVVAADASFSAVKLIEYSFLPKKQIQTYSFNATIDNVALGAVNNAYAELFVVNANSQVLYNALSDTAATITAGNSATVNFPGTFTPTDTGFYFLQYVLFSDGDVNTLNDTLTDFFVVTDTTYGRDDNNVTGALGIGAGSSAVGSFLGQAYEVVTPVALTSVTGAFTAPTIGDTASFSVFSIDNGVPGALIAESEIFIFTDSAFIVLDLSFPNLVVLDVDTYLVAVREYSDNVTIGTSTGKFTPGTVWINWPGSPFGTWENSENFGAQFARTFTIRPNFGACPVTIDTAFVQQPSCPDALDGVVLIEATPGFGSLTFDWSNGDTDSIAEFLTGQTYSVTIEDGLGCKTQATYALDLVAPIAVTVSVTNATTPTAADGGASASVTGGTAPFTFEWSNDSTSTAVSGLTAGTVSVTVTDANGCDKVATATVGAGVGIFTPANNLVAKVYPNPAANQVFVELTLSNTSDVNIAVLNNLGQVVIRQTESNVQVMNASVDVSALPAGIYMIQISSDNASTAQKLIVE
jgi:hypothetical protein